MVDDRVKVFFNLCVEELNNEKTSRSVQITPIEETVEFTFGTISGLDKYRANATEEYRNTHSLNGSLMIKMSTKNIPIKHSSEIVFDFLCPIVDRKNAKIRLFRVVPSPSQEVLYARLDELESISKALEYRLNAWAKLALDEAIEQFDRTIQL